MRQDDLLGADSEKPIRKDNGGPDDPGDDDPDLERPTPAPTQGVRDRDYGERHAEDERVESEDGGSREDRPVNTMLDRRRTRGDMTIAAMSPLMIAAIARARDEAFRGAGRAFRTPGAYGRRPKTRDSGG
jgi:hypothetical protein